MTRYRLGGLFLLLAAVYLVGEAWAVAGWQGRDYAWTVDAISLLGVPEPMHWDGTSAESTRHAWMNATFITSGLRVSIAGLLLAPFVPRHGRLLVLAILLVHGIGTVLVGLFPAGLTAVRANMHGLGAGMSIIGGAALLTVLALVLAAQYPRLAIFTGVCALIGLVGCVLAFVGVGPFGLVERAAVDAVIIWQIVAGVIFLGVGRPAGDTP